MKKFTLSMALAVAMAVLLLGSVALAAASHLGALDFLARTLGGQDLDPEKVSEMIVTDPAQVTTETSQAAFHVREAIFDGNHLYMVVEAKPVKPDVLLLGAMVELGDGMEYMGPDFAGMKETVGEWAEGLGRTHVINTSVFYAQQEEEQAEELFSNWGIDMFFEADGTQLYMVYAGLSQMQQTLDFELSCQTMDYEDPDNRERVTLPLHFESSDAGFAAVSTPDALFEDCGVRVDSVRLRATPMATCTRVEYTVVDEQAYALTNDGLWFEFLDESGQSMDGGAAGAGTTGELEAVDARRRFYQETGISVMTSMPESLTLRGFNCWEKNRYAAHEIFFEAQP